MNWFDRVIGFISPKAACTRVAWRQQLDLLRGFGYDAADNGRSNMNWRAVNEAADLTDRSARDVVRARARDLERNSDIFNGVVSSFKRNIIGTGFTLQVRTGNDELDSQIEVTPFLDTFIDAAIKEMDEVAENIADEITKE